MPSVFAFVKQAIIFKAPPSVGRYLFLLIILIYLLMFTLLHLAFERTTAWNILGVPALTPTFADTRIIFAALETHRAGLDPMISNPRDPWKRRMMYPRVWLSLSKLGLTLADTDSVGIGIVVIFYMSLFYWLRRLEAVTCIAVALFICSYPVMLAIERGNLDLLMIAICAIALGFVERNPSMRPVLYLSILSAAILKLYPFAGVLVVLGDVRRRAIAWLLFLTTIFTLYILLTADDLLAIMRNASKSINYSFGFGVIFGLLPSPFDRLIFFQLISLIILCLALFRCLPERLPLWSSANTHCRDSFLLGCGIYTGTFLLGYNFDYKLMFLVFLIPQLIQWLRGDEGFASRATPLLFAVMLSVFGEFPLRIIVPSGAILLQEASNWVIFILIIYTLMSATFVRCRRLKS